MNILKKLFVQSMVISTSILFLNGISAVIQHFRGTDLVLQWYHPLTIVLASDLHAGYHNRAKELERWVDLINAESDAELQNASRLMSGELQKLLSDVEASLIDARAQIDAYLDYPEDLDSPIVPMQPINQAKATITRLL